MQVEQTREVRGNSPPSVFVSSLGYPFVNAGPMVPPMTGDTSFLDEPEGWLEKGFGKVVLYRLALIRGGKKFNARKFDESYLLKIHELVMSSEPVGASMRLTKKPERRLYLSEYNSPMGPYAPLEDFSIESSKSDHRIEKAYYDHDMNASEAVISLYKDGLTVNKIQKILSTGMIGKKKNRKIVPTRWSITAVDDIVSKYLISKIRDYESINDYRVYRFVYDRNAYCAILFPDYWSFEWIESWFPGTTWNRDGSYEYVIGDSEDRNGRSKYAKVGGCYYAVRLAIAESLYSMRRRAGALVLREIYPGFPSKIGVWNVRESVRRMMRQRYQTFSTFKDALNSTLPDFKTSFKKWEMASKLIKGQIYQERLI